jgi:hypothetical protein
MNNGYVYEVPLNTSSSDMLTFHVRPIMSLPTIHMVTSPPFLDATTLATHSLGLPGYMIIDGPFEALATVVADEDI